VNNEVPMDKISYVNKRGPSTSSSELSASKWLKPNYEPMLTTPEVYCEQGDEPLVLRRMRSTKRKEMEGFKNGFTSTIEILLSPESYDFLEQVHIQFECRDVSIDPNREKCRRPAL
jgi:hypothetical protein